MANTLISQKEAGGMHYYVFETTSASTTETCQLPLGKAWALATCTYVGGTATVPSYSYVRATGVLTITLLTATNNILFGVMTD